MEITPAGDDHNDNLKIGVVGPCAGGKTTLIQALKQYGFDGKHIAQEHSYVKDMWQRISKPDVLIYLDVSYPISKNRRDMNWSQKEFDLQVVRLEHARINANIYIDTDELNPDQVLQRVLAYLRQLSNNKFHSPL